MASQKSTELRSIIYAAVSLALCLVLPFLTGNIPAIGQQFAPMHFPVLLCGYLAGPLWGGVVGVVAPFMRNLLFGAPVLYPQAIRMAFELCVYGAAAGLFYRYLPKKPLGVYVSLLCAMFFGRLSWALAQFILSVLDKTQPFYPELVVTQTVTSSLYGILIQIVLIPPLVLALQRAKLITKY
ncbi:MAG: ECF transporter S component [Clostridia bacterium]|nr:ECF transporter S component [Clostridia bacterium]